MPSIFSSIFGQKPTVPNLPTLSLTAEQQKALAANVAALPQTEQLATSVDLFNQKQIDQMLSSIIPNYAAINQNVSQNIASLTAGQIPTDVSEAVQTSAAAQSLAGGFGGTGSQRNLVARDLGLTSLDLTQRGLSSAESWMKTASSIYEPGMFNVSSMFISPQQQAQFDVQQNEAQFQRQWMQNQISAMPAPWATFTTNLIDRALSAYSGTPVGNNPYSTPGSFDFTGSGGEGGAGFGPGGDSFNTNFSGDTSADFGGEMGGGGLGGILGGFG